MSDSFIGTVVELERLYMYVCMYVCSVLARDLKPSGAEVSSIAFGSPSAVA